MPLHRYLLLLLCTILLLTCPLDLFAETFRPTKTLPIGERWFRIFFNDQPTGFSYVRIREDQTGYELYSESSVKMGGFAFSRDAVIRETYSVNKDLTLRSLVVDQTIDGSPMIVKGEASTAGIKVIIDSTGRKQEKFLRNKGSIYAPIVLNFIPLIRGTEAGKVHRIAMLDTEAVKIKKVKISVIGREIIGETKTVHIKNDLYPVSNDIWVDTQGNTIKESIRDGWITTVAEDEKVVREFVAEAALGRRDFIIGFSRISVQTPISKPSDVKKMVVELSQLPDSTQLVTNAVQKAQSMAQKAVITTDNSLASTPAIASDLRKVREYLQSTEEFPASSPILIAKKNQVVGAEAEPRKITEKLTQWVASHIKDKGTETRSALETLQRSEGNSLDRARLFASLARAAGIPARVVSGLSYFHEARFMYHSWAETYIGDWLPVDPTFGEVPANATHIKLVEGDSPDDLIKLSKFVGKIKVKLLEVKY